MLFYFSATGNSKRTAEIIAERTGDRLVSISGAPKEREAISRKSTRLHGAFQRLGYEKAY